MVLFSLGVRPLSFCLIHFQFHHLSWNLLTKALIINTSTRQSIQSIPINDMNLSRKKWGLRETHRWRCLLGFSLSKASRESKQINSEYLQSTCFWSTNISERYRLVCPLLVEQIISLGDWRILLIDSCHLWVRLQPTMSAVVLLAS